MAGFMAGFGQAFSSSFEKAQARKADFENDVFKLTFNTYLENDKERKKAEKADADAVRKATALAETLPGVNKKAATAQIYKMLSSGLDEKFIMEKLQEPGARIEFSQEVSRNKDDLEAQTEAVTAPGPNDQRQQNLEQVQQTQQPQTPSSAPSWKDTFAGGLFNSPYSKKQDQMRDKAIGKISTATGVGQDQIRNTLTGSTGIKPGIDTSSVVFTPGKATGKAPTSAENAYVLAQQAYARGDKGEGDRYMNDFNNFMKVYSSKKGAEAIAQAGVVTPGQPVKIFSEETGRYKKVSPIPGPVDPTTGQPSLIDPDTKQPIDPNSVVKISKEESDRADDALNRLKDPLLQNAEARHSYGNVISNMGTVAEIAQRSPEALTYASSTTADTLAKLRQEGLNFGSMFNIIGAEKQFQGMLNTRKIDQGTISKTVEEGRSALAKLDQDVATGKISQIAADAAKIKTINLLSAYELAGAYGQTGRAVSENELALFKEAVSDGIGIPRQIQAMSQLSQLLEKKVDSQTQALYSPENPMIQTFIKDYGYSPIGEAPRPVREATVGNDPRLQATYDLFKKYGDGSSGQVNPSPAPTTPVPTKAPAPGQMATPAQPTAPSEAIEILKKDPTSRNIELFKKHFGATDETINQLLSGNEKWMKP